MARIAGVDIPRNKQIAYSLPYIYGIGSTRAVQILERLKIDKTTKVSDLTEEELNRLREVIDKEKWWDMLSHFIDVLRINIFVVDGQGQIILPPEKGRYGGRLLTDPPTGQSRTTYYFAIGYPY